MSDKVFIVCDGVGGEKMGEVASAIVSESVYYYLYNQEIETGKEQYFIERAIFYANTKLRDYAATHPSAKRMCTTIGLVLLGSQTVTASWCGDTRVHHIRAGRIRWKSKDHSLVAELVSQGELTENEARIHPQRNLITRSINALNINSYVDFYELQDVESGDYLLVCSDGLLEKMDDITIFNTLENHNGRNLQEAFYNVCNGATRDNFSMYLVQCSRIL